jgi:hypothetical protein
MKLKLEQFSDGQIYISDEDDNTGASLHAVMTDKPHQYTLQLSSCPEPVIELDKLYGPLIFMPIRITLDIGKCEWVIERRNGDNWGEVARIPGQLDSDFST